MPKCQNFKCDILSNFQTMWFCLIFNKTVSVRILGTLDREVLSILSFLQLQGYCRVALFYELPRLSWAPFLFGCSSLIRVGSRQPVAGEPSKRKEKKKLFIKVGLRRAFYHRNILVSKPYSMYSMYFVMKVIRKLAKQ